jgi:transcriptional repressor NrdR
VPARLIGELVMDELHQLDEVAYVRFASVYRSFQDVDAFREEIERLQHRRPRSAEELQLGLWAGLDDKGAEKNTPTAAEKNVLPVVRPVAVPGKK